MPRDRTHRSTLQLGFHLRMPLGRVSLMFLKRKLFFMNDKLARAHQELNQWNVSISLGERIRVHSNVIDPTNFAVLVGQGSADNLYTDSDSPVAGNTCSLILQVIIEKFRVADRQVLA